MKYLVYSIDNGRVERALQCVDSLLHLNIRDGESCIINDFDGIDVFNMLVHHETGTLLERQDYTLDALPLPCTVTIEGVEYHCTEQPVFEFDLPGTYTIQVDAGPRFLQKEFTIDYQT